MSEQTPEKAIDPARRNLLILLFAGFVLTGIATVIIGPLLPVFIPRWSLDDVQAGFFSSVQFASAMAGVGMSSVLSSWRGYRPALVLGYLLMGAGLATFNSNSHMVALAATASFGGGYGLVIPGTNLLAAEAGGKKSASMVSLLNFAWGAGAVTCSPLVLLALKHEELPALLSGFAFLGGLMALGLLLVSFGTDKHGETGTSGDGGTTGPSLAIAAALAALFFIYVAMENGVGVWAAEYAKRLAKGTTGMTTLAPMFFYTGLMSGRATAPLVLLRLHERRLVLGALSLAASGTAILIASTTLKFAIVGVFLAGLGCASIYPIYIVWLSKWYGSRAKRIGGVFFGVGSLGGLAGPPLIGFVSKHSGSLRIGLLVPLLSALIMIGLVLLLRRRTAA